MAAAFVAPPSGGVIKYCRSVPRLRLCQGSVLLLAWGCGGGGGGGGVSTGRSERRWRPGDNQGRDGIQSVPGARSNGASLSG